MMKVKDHEKNFVDVLFPQVVLFAIILFLVFHPQVAIHAEGEGYTEPIDSVFQRKKRGWVVQYSLVKILLGYINIHYALYMQ